MTYGRDGDWHSYVDRKLVYEPNNRKGVWESVAYNANRFLRLWSVSNNVTKQASGE